MIPPFLSGLSADQIIALASVAGVYAGGILFLAGRLLTGEGA